MSGMREPDVTKVMKNSGIPQLSQFRKLRNFCDFRSFVLLVFFFRSSRKPPEFFAMKAPFSNPGWNLYILVCCARLKRCSWTGWGCTYFLLLAFVVVVIVIVG